MKTGTILLAGLVVVLPTPVALADDTGNPPAPSPTTQASGWEGFHASRPSADLPTVLEYYQSRAWVQQAVADIEEGRKLLRQEDEGFKRHWTFRRRLFRYHFAEHQQLGLGYYKQSDIRGFTVALIVNWR